jgi:hypothetical protein
MKKVLLVIVVIETCLLILFSVNIYTELTSPPKIENWYISIIDEDFSGMSEKEVFHKFSNIGFKVVDIIKEVDGSTAYIIKPPFDQGIYATARNRFFFDFMIRIDKKGRVTNYGLNK